MGELSPAPLEVRRTGASAELRLDPGSGKDLANSADTVLSMVKQNKTAAEKHCLLSKMLQQISVTTV